MNADIRSIPPVTLIGISAIGPSSFNELASGKDFGDQLWISLINLMIKGGLSPHRRMYGVSWPADSLTPPDLINYFVGFEKPNEGYGDDFSPLELEGGNYFRFLYQGDPHKVDEGFRSAYIEALPKSGYKTRNGQHLEIYPEDIDMSSHKISFEILIPIM